MTVKNRDNSIDLFRGIAALFIIFIHTTFWSGESYVPTIVKTISLCIDVPFFFVLSGMSSTYAKGLKKPIVSLIKQYFRYVLFVIFYFAALLVMGLLFNQWEGITLREFYLNLLFRSEQYTSLPVVMGSIWFMPVYFVVYPIGIIISYILKKNSKDEKELNGSYLVLLTLVFIGVVFSWNYMLIFGISAQSCFYLFFFILGIVLKDKIIKLLPMIISLVSIFAAIFVLWWILDFDVVNMQLMKFPPNIVWLLYSLIAVVVMQYLRPKLKNISSKNYICWIGRNAIYFYFAQGISSSLIFKLLPHFNMNWYFKLPIMYVINVAFALCFVFALKGFIFSVEKLISVIYDKFISKSKVQDAL